MLVIRLILISFFLPLFASASVVINEIMYDLEGSDSGREWVEIYNNGSSPVDLTGWKFFEANTNHVLTLVQGNINISGNGFAVIVDNAEKFLVDWPNFSGTLFDSSFSFSNTGESLTLRNSDLADVDTVTYSSDWGANGDGNSLQKIDGQWKVGSPTPGAQNSASTSDVDVSESPEPTSDIGSQSWPTEPQIYANAGEDRNAIAGADIKFSGRALGLQKEPLENARYLWSFGDGAGAESQNVLHTYHYPGDYIVVLNVSSGKYSASDRLLVKVLENNLKIIEANENYIKLHNGSKFDLDISSWFLRANSKLFKFPESTLIKSSADLSIPSSISGINVNNNQTVDLLYPNASIAYSYSPTPNIEYPVSNIAVAEPKPTTVVDSSPEVKDAGNSASDNEENTQQTASVISVGQNNSWGLKKWLAIILGIGIIAGAGLLIIRRQSSV